MEMQYGTRAMLDVVRERVRQQSKKGWTLEHDDRHTEGELAKAAACYALSNDRWARPAADRLAPFFQSIWPFSWSWWKPKDRRRDLVRAAALIVAEIERLDRAEERATE